MKTISRLLTLVLCLALCLSLAACGGGSGSKPAAEGESKVFVYGTDANSTTFDPASDLQTNSGNFLVHAVGETLWTCTADGDMSLKLAEKVDYTPEHLDITLKQGVKFSNGDEMTVADVLFTFRHVASQPRTASMYACMNLDAAQADGDYHVTIPMNYYDAALIDLLGNASCLILDEKVAGADGYAFDWLIGTGPYMLKGDGVTDKSGWEESVQYTLVRNPYYWGEAPYYDEFDVKFYSQEATRYADLQAGNLDAAYLTEATYINNLGKGAVPGTSLITVKENAVQYFQMARKLGEASGEPGEPSYFDDINVRKALAHCLDIKTMVETLGEGVYEVATGLIGEGSWVYEELPVYEYDPELAKEYLAAAGYGPDNPLTVEVCAEGTAWASALFESAQSYCAAIGINLDLSGVTDFGTILPRLIGNQVPMSMGQPSNGSGNDPANLLQQFGPESDNSMLRITDDDLAELFREGTTSTDKAARVSIYQDFLRGVYERYYVIPICVSTKNFGVKDVHASFAAAIDTSNQVDPVLLTD